MIHGAAVQPGDEPPVLIARLLGLVRLPGSPTAEATAAIVKNLLALYQLRPRLVAATTDTTAVMPATVAIINACGHDDIAAKDRHVHCVGCFCHRLHLCVTLTIEAAAPPCIGIVHKLVLKIRNSAVLFSFFEGLQKAPANVRTPLPEAVQATAESLASEFADLAADLAKDTQPKTSAPPIPVVIRWNSTYRMMKWAWVNQNALVALSEAEEAVEKHGLPTVDHRFFQDEVQPLLGILSAFDYATRCFSADSYVTISAVLPMLMDIRSLLFKLAGTKPPTVPQLTAPQIAEQLAEELRRPLASLVDDAIADGGGGGDDDDDDDDVDDCDGDVGDGEVGDDGDNDVVVENDDPPNATPGEVAAAGAAVAREGDDRQKAARKLKQELKKLQKAALSESNPAAKTALEKQALDLTLALGTKEFFPECWLQFNRRFNGCFDDTLLVTGMLLDPGNRSLLTPEFVDERQQLRLKHVLAIELTSHIVARTSQDIAGIAPDVAAAPAPAAAAAAAAGGGSPPPPKRLLGFRGALAPYTPTVTASPAASLAKAELDRYWGLPDSGHMPALHWWHLQRKDMPHLADLALKVLHIPASSTSSERIFSAAGLTATSRRGRLNAARFANTLRVRFNHPAAIASRSRSK
jgi:hypothetical protein